MFNTKILKVDKVSPEKEKIKEAAAVIKDGGVVALPTDTVYGLAVDSANNKALKRLFKIKDRPANKPFSLLISDISMLEVLGVEVTKLAAEYIKRFWPGALTIILEAKGGQKLALRLPDNKIARELIRCSEVALACPSANLSGEEPLKTASEIKRIFDGAIELIIDSGEEITGRESSLIDLTGKTPCLLREGAISKKKLLG